MSLQDVQDQDDQLEDDDLPEGEEAEQETDQEGDEPEAQPDQEAAEERARRLGWVPKDQFKGNPDEWRPADEWLAFGEQNNATLRSSLRRLEQRYADLERQSKAAADWREKVEERARQDAYDRLKGEMTVAAESGDMDAYRAAQERLDRHVEETGRPAERTEQVTVPPETQAWIDQNPWFSQDEHLHGVAKAINVAVANEYPGLSIPEQLEETKRRVMLANPDNKWFRRPDSGNQRPRRQRQDVEGAGATATSTRTNSKGWRDLPKDAQAGWEEIKSQFGKDEKGNWRYSKEDYAKDYFELEE